MKKYKQIVIFAGCIALFSSCASTNKARTDEPAVCKEVVSVRNEMPSLLPANKQFKLVWNDEFNGNALDESKWCYRTCFWGRRAHWFAEPKDNAVEVKDGKVYLKIVKKEDGQLVTPLLQTGHLIWDYIHDNKSSFWPISKVEKPIFLHRYGFYECRCRTQQMPGWWSAFWMQSECKELLLIRLTQASSMISWNVSLPEPSFLPASITAVVVQITFSLPVPERKEM